MSLKRRYQVVFKSLQGIKPVKLREIKAEGSERIELHFASLRF
jgi:hypothetical protein